MNCARRQCAHSRQLIFPYDSVTKKRRAVLKLIQMRRLCGAAHEVRACIACCSSAFARNESTYIALQQSIKPRETPWSIRPSKGRRHHDLRTTRSRPCELSYPKAFGKRVSRRGLLLRLFDAMMASRQRQVDREIARYLASIGGDLTDEAEAST
jgi:hypothetical protein